MTDKCRDMLIKEISILLPKTINISDAMKNIIIELCLFMFKKGYLLAVNEYKYKESIK